MRTLLIFGATRNSGWQLAQLAHARGLRVAALARPGRGEALHALGIQVIEGDARCLTDCQRALTVAQPDSVVSLLGGRNEDGIRVDAVGNLNVIAACETAEVTHALLVTSFGCGALFRQLSPAAVALLGDAIGAKNEAEARWQASPLLTTIVRPGGLDHGAGCGRWRLHDGSAGSGATLARADLALALLALLDAPPQHKRTLCVSGAG